jgi:hypothetical protein
LRPALAAVFEKPTFELNLGGDSHWGPLQEYAHTHTTCHTIRETHDLAHT